MTMHRRHHIWARSMHSGMNHIPRRIDRVHIPTHHLALIIDQGQILRPHPAETLAVRVDPKVVR